MQTSHPLFVPLKFVGITFLLTFTMNGLMAYAINSGLTSAASSFAGVQMLYPALVAIWMLGGLSKGSGALQGKTRGFSKAYAFTTFLCIMILIIGTLTKSSTLIGNAALPATLLSLPLFLFLVFDQKNSLDAFKLGFKKGFGPGLLAVAVYALITTFLMIPSAIFEGQTLSEIFAAIQLKTLISASGTITWVLGLNILLGCIIFIGEELGWRYYLQPHLQNALGKRGGVITLGIVWGLWHAPLNFMLYNPKTPLLGILFHILFCTALGIFLAYVYVKTNNLWPCILIHLFNNSRALVFNPTMESELTLATTLTAGLLLLMAFGPFLFSRVFKARSVELPSLLQEDIAQVSDTIAS